MSRYGDTGEVMARIDKRAAERRAELLAREDAEKERSHRAWLRLCGMMSPIGGLQK